MFWLILIMAILIFAFTAPVFYDISNQVLSQYSDPKVKIMVSLLFPALLFTTFYVIFVAG